MMDTSSSANSASPDRESITFTPVQNKFRGFIPRIIGLSPMSILSESADDEYEEKDLQGLFGLGCHPALLNIPSITNDLLFPRGILVSDPGAIQGHMVSTFSETDPIAGVISPEEAPTRILKIGNIQNIAAPILFKIIQDEGNIQALYTGMLDQQGIIVVTFVELIEAVVTYTKINDGGRWSVCYFPQAFPIMVGPEEVENQVTCTVTSGLTSRNMVTYLYESVAAFGNIIDFTVVRNCGLPTFKFTFGNHYAASSVAATLDGQYIKCFKVSVTTNQFSPLSVTSNVPPGIIVTSDIDNQGIWSPHPFYRIESSSEISPLSELGRHWYQTSHTPSEHSQLSPFSQFSERGYSPAPTSTGCFVFPSSPSAQSRSVGSIDSRDSYRKKSPVPSYEPKRPSHLAVPGKNVINLERIAIGSDTRTTVMLRNIPNKVDQQTLKEYIDETSRGLYNFLYLRIDFHNVCNVGYAFINFLDPLDIIEFVKAKSGTRWNKFNSEKVLDVTYANIQGIDQLIEKFRNSSVMDQDPAYRPKLFHSSGSLAGTEAEFPPPNNILKKCRSVSAAQQIGLFAPKSSPAHSKSSWRKRD